MSQLVKSPPAMQETWVRSLGLEDPLEKGKATRSSILAWIVPWTEEPDGLQSTGSQESDTTEQLSTKLKDEFFPTRNNTPGTLAQNIFSHVHVPA